MSGCPLELLFLVFLVICVHCDSESAVVQHGQVQYVWPRPAASDGDYVYLPIGVYLFWWVSSISLLTQVLKGARSGFGSNDGRV